MKIRVILADDHVMLREGIKQLLEFDQTIQVVAEANDGIECLEKNINDFVDEFINNPEKALLNEVPELEKLGFKKANEEFDGSYLRGGKVDNPKDVLDELLLYSPNAEVVFYITYSTPYDCNYSYYYRIEEE